MLIPLAQLRQEKWRSGRIGRMFVHVAKRTPETLVEYQQRFASEEACWEYLMERRWPSGYLCPSCGHDKFYKLLRRRLLQCVSCRKQTSVTAGTLMHRTKLPLRYWFWVMILMSWHKRSVSAKQVQADLGIGSYETAWLLLHKIREAMSAGERLLTGFVEVDDGYVGGVEAGVHGRETETKAKIVVAVEVLEEGVCGKVAIRVVEAMSAEELVPALKETVAPGATVKTDGWAAYAGLGEEGFEHEIVVGNCTKFPHVNRVFSNLKRVLLCTHAGRQSAKHLQKYINDFVYRFNRRGWFMQLLDSVTRRAMKAQPFTYATLVT